MAKASCNERSEPLSSNKALNRAKAELPERSNADVEGIKVTATEHQQTSQERRHDSVAMYAEVCDEMRMGECREPMSPGDRLGSKTVDSCAPNVMEVNHSHCGVKSDFISLLGVDLPRLSVAKNEHV